MTHQKSAHASDFAALRDRLGFTIDQASEYLGVPVPTYKKWESGEREPSASVLRLVHVLGFMEAMAPALHEALIPKSVATSDKERVSQKRPGTPARRKSVASPDKAGVTQL